MIETVQLYRATAHAIGHKRMASTMGISLQHSYVLTNDPISREAPVRDDVERITNLMEANATHGAAGKAANVHFELYFTELFDRVNRHEIPTALTCETVVTEAQKAIAEFGQLLAECRPGFTPDRVLAEAADVITALRRLAVCAEAADDVTPRIRKVK